MTLVRRLELLPLSYARSVERQRARHHRGWHVPEDARRRRVEVEHFGSEVLEPSFGEQACQLAGGQRRGGSGGTGTAGLGHQGDASAGPQQSGDFA
jgi:hypothetical protein